MALADYVGNIYRSVKSIGWGMSVTLAYLWQRPAVIQYPDRIPKRIQEELPENYRGHLMVEMDICTACKACERDCPIECIAIDAEKDPVTRGLVMSKFDIDLAKCMYCGLCSEHCPTGAIHHTREFEGSTENLHTLLKVFVPHGEMIPAYNEKAAKAAAAAAPGAAAKPAVSATAAAPAIPKVERPPVPVAEKQSVVAPATPTQAEKAAAAPVTPIAQEKPNPAIADDPSKVDTKK